jgi:hypothetical protein
LAPMGKGGNLGSGFLVLLTRDKPLELRRGLVLVLCDFCFRKQSDNLATYLVFDKSRTWLLGTRSRISYETFPVPVPSSLVSTPAPFAGLWPVMMAVPVTVMFQKN